MMLSRMLALCAALVLMAGVAAAQTAGPSLGELARQKKAGKTGAKKVITTEDMKPAAAEGESSAAPAPATGDAATGSGGAAAAGENAAAKPEAAPAEGAAPQPDEPMTPEVAELKKKVDRISENEQGWQNTLKENEKKLEEADDDFRREMYEQVISNSRQNIQTLSEERKQAEAELKAARDKAKQNKEGQSSAAESN